MMVTSSLRSTYLILSIQKFHLSRKVIMKLWLIQSLQSAPCTCKNLTKLHHRLCNSLLFIRLSQRHTMLLLKVGWPNTMIIILARTIVFIVAFVVTYKFLDFDRFICKVIMFTYYVLQVHMHVCTCICICMYKGGHTEYVQCECLWVAG